jgi:predicted ATPase
LLGRAEARGDRELLLQAHHCCWASRYSAGELSACRHHIEAGQAIYATGDFRAHAQLYGNHDAKVCGHGELAQVAWMEGRLEEAALEDRRAGEWARVLNHLGSTMHAMDMALLYRSYLRDRRGAYELASKLIELAEDQGHADHHARGLIFRGWAASSTGEVGSGLDDLVAGLERQRDIGTTEDLPVHQCLHAEALLAAGKPDRALEILASTERELQAIGVKVWLPEVWRMIGDVTQLVSPDAVEAADRAYQTANRIAVEQGTNMLRLRALLGQARLHHRMGGDRTVLKEIRIVCQLIGGGPSEDLLLADRLLDEEEPPVAATP